MPGRRTGQRLRVVAGGGLDTFDQRNEVWTPNELFFERPQALPGEAVESGGRSLFYNWNVNAVHSYFADGGSASTSAGVQYEDRRLNTFRIRTQNLLPGQRNVNQGTNITAVENLEEERTFALYAQEEIRLLSDRLLVQAGIRAERSSVNGDIDKFYIFPKASGSYRFPDCWATTARSSSAWPTARRGTSPSSGRSSRTWAPRSSVGARASPSPPRRVRPTSSPSGSRNGRQASTAR
jgi:hypothetical protein